MSSRKTLTSAARENDEKNLSLERRGQCFSVARTCESEKEAAFVCGSLLMREGTTRNNRGEESVREKAEERKLIYVPCVQVDGCFHLSLRLHIPFPPAARRRRVKYTCGQRTEQITCRTERNIRERHEIHVLTFSGTVCRAVGEKPRSRGGTSSSRCRRAAKRYATRPLSLCRTVTQCVSLSLVPV